jgi:hypothetical protein
MKHRLNVPLRKPGSLMRLGSSFARARRSIILLVLQLGSPFERDWTTALD